MRQVAVDLLEALKALKACKDVIKAVSLENNPAYLEANRILDKYPNLERIP